MRARAGAAAPSSLSSRGKRVRSLRSGEPCERRGISRSGAGLREILRKLRMTWFLEALRSVERAVISRSNASALERPSANSSAPGKLGGGDREDHAFERHRLDEVERQAAQRRRPGTPLLGDRPPKHQSMPG